MLKKIAIIGADKISYFGKVLRDTAQHTDSHSCLLTIETILEVFPSIHVTANSIFTAICITLDLNIYYSRPLERFLYKTHLTQH